MKNIQLFALSILLFLFSCKKDELRSTAESIPDTELFSPWISVDDWSRSEQLHQSSIPLQGSDDSTLATSLVFLYIKNKENNPVLLPAKIGTSQWYYQVEKDKITINRSSPDMPGKEEYQFKYKILTSTDLDKLEQKGFSKSTLLNMDFDQLKKALQ